MSESGVKPPRINEVAKAIVKLQQIPKLREALILRFCMLGLGLKEILELRIGEIVDTRNPCRINPVWIAKSFHFDRALKRYRGGSFSDAVRKYLEWNYLVGDLMFPIGGARAVQKVLNAYSTLSIREVKRVAKSQMQSVDSQCVKNLEEFLTRPIHGGFATHLTRDGHDRDDALQDARLAILDFHKCNESVVSEHAGEMIKRNVIRDKASRTREYRAIFVCESDIDNRAISTPLCDGLGGNYRDYFASKFLDSTFDLVFKAIENELSQSEQDVILREFGIKGIRRRKRQPGSRGSRVLEKALARLRKALDDTDLEFDERL